MFQHVLNVMLFAVVPLALAAIGAHLATEELPEGSAKRRNILIGVWFLAFFGIACGILVEMLNAKADHKREAEAVDLNVKVDFVGKQNEQLLTSLLGVHPLSETDRRKKIEDALRSDYILHHDPIDPLILSGQSYPPTDWMNQRLRQMGENWNFKETSSLSTVAKTPRSYIVPEGGPMYPSGDSISGGELKAGSPILINIKTKATGPNEVLGIWEPAVIMLLPDYSSETQRAALKDFNSSIDELYKQNHAISVTIPPGSESFFSVFPKDSNPKVPPVFTEAQVNDLRSGKSFFFIFYSLIYKDSGLIHHQRGCYFLQNPVSASQNWIWHSCEVNVNSD